MASPPRPLIAGNWKMNGLQRSVGELEAIIAAARPLEGRVDLLVCPPATLIARFAALAHGSVVAIGGQDCHPEASGAFTGDISAEMLKDAGASAVIVGHSERRAYHRESDAEIQAKARAAARAGLLAIICVGETQEQRTAGQALEVVGQQLRGSLPASVTPQSVAIAYEPVWAIGSGLTPTPADVAAVHGFIRQHLGISLGSAGQGVRILYGGSVKPSNARELLRADNVNGALVGGASLRAGEFLQIAQSCV